MIVLYVSWMILFFAVIVLNIWYSVKAFTNKNQKFSDEPITWVSGFWVYRSDMFTDEGNKYRKMIIKSYLGFLALIPVGFLIRNAI